MLNIIGASGQSSNSYKWKQTKHSTVYQVD